MFNLNGTMNVLHAVPINKMIWCFIAATSPLGSSERLNPKRHCCSSIMLSQNPKKPISFSRKEKNNVENYNTLFF